MHMAAQSNPFQLDSPEKASLKRKLKETNSKLSQSKKKIKTLQQTKRRLLKREAKLTSIIANLRSKNVPRPDSLSVLETCGSGIGDLLKRCEAKSEGKGQPAKYSPELRSFALTLHFYSPKAYAYVRKAFDTCLPHPRTIKKWYDYETVEDGPGFNAASFQLIQSRVEALQRNGKVAPWALIMDEMAIRQHIEWDGTKYQGYIDMGTHMDNDSLPVAKEALAFMLSQRDAQHVTIWLDNCSSQNKNWTLYSMIVHAVNDETFTEIKAVTLKYFEPGHTFMAADSTHAKIEKVLKRKDGKIFDFDDFQQCVEEAGCHVHAMVVSDFADWESGASNYHLSRAEPRPYLSKIVWAEFRRDAPETLFFKESFTDQEASSCSFIKKGYDPTPKFRKNPRGIANEKKEKILKKLVPLMPQNRKSFWEELPMNPKSKDLATALV
ncbi:THAP domain-containing protein 9 [Elysia marginata]|uniref:THAP domain-containing protein 9 n=1 Tax=Elysia marginata TaxID=1093978 RepID=A0AAV4FP18_9GAST|nr:THAP domain-containing protein 9 [Elysia marginata]